MKDNRIAHYDGIKFVAMLIVFTTHYMADFQYDVFDNLPKFLKFILVDGISGKMGVAFFGVILGYLASLSKKESFFYVLFRYGYFVFAGFLINILTFILPREFREFSGCVDKISFLVVLKNTVLLGAEIYPTYWCMSSFLVASIICYLNGKYNLSLFETILQVLILMYFNQMWVGICVLGYLFRVSKETFLVRKIFDRKESAFLVLALFFICKLKLGACLHLLNGIFAVVLLWYLEYHVRIREAVGNRLFSALGKNTMGMYLSHVICYYYVGTWFVEMGKRCGHYGLGACIGWFFSLIFICIFAYPVEWVLQNIMKLLSNHSYLKNVIEKKEY